MIPIIMSCQCLLHTFPCIGVCLFTKAKHLQRVGCGTRGIVCVIGKALLRAHSLSILNLFMIKSEVQSAPSNDDRWCHHGQCHDGLPRSPVDVRRKYKVHFWATYFWVKSFMLLHQDNYKLVPPPCRTYALCTYDIFKLKWSSPF